MCFRNILLGAYILVSLGAYALFSQNLADFDRVVAIEDCYIEKRADTGEGATENFNTWRIWGRADDDKHARIAYLKFSLDDSPYLFAEDVDSVFLQLTINKVFNYSGGFSTFSLYDIGDNSWDETTLTWDTAPWFKENATEPIAVFTDTLEQISTNDPVLPLLLDISDYVKNQLSQGNTTFSLALCDTSYWETSANFTDIRFYSKDCLDPVLGEGAEKDPDSTYFPSLYIKETSGSNAMNLIGYDKITASEDCYIEKRADTGEGATENFNTWRIWARADDDKHARIAYLKFSLDESPYLFAEDVDSVYLKLTINRLFNYSGGFSTFSLYDIGDNSWDETTLTWDTAPWFKENANVPIAEFSDTLEQISTSDPIHPLFFDISDYVKDQLSQGNTTFSLVLCDTSYWETSANFTDIRLYSKDCLDPVLGAGADKDPDSTFFPSLYIKGTDVSSALFDENKKPNGFNLYQNYPNPFNPVTKISFNIPKTENVNLIIYNVLGEKIKDLINTKKNAGYYQISWDGKDNQGRNVASGLYIASLGIANQKQTIKMLLIR